MSIDNIVNKILEDANKRKAEILEKANKKAQEIKSLKEIELNNRLEKNRLLAEKEGNEKRERYLQNAKINARDEKLKAKQEIINMVYKKALEKLNDLSEEDFISYFSNGIRNLSDIKDGLVIVNSKRYKIINEGLLAKLNSNLKIGKIDDSIDDGFIVKDGNIYYNFTFKSILNSLQSEISQELAKELFK